MESIQLPNDVSLTKSLGAIIFLNLVVGGFVAARIVACCGREDRRPFADDVLSFIALIMLSCYSAITYTFDTPNNSQLANLSVTTINYVLYQNMILTTLSACTMYLSKTPLLILSARVFGVKKWLRITSYATLVTSFIVFLATTAVVDATCSQKVVTDEDIFLLGDCLKITVSVGVVNGSTAVVTDIIIILLPLPVIAGLNLPFHKKIGIAVVFLTGIFAIAASAISLYFKSLSLAGHSTALVTTLFCTIIECSLAIIVGCAPAIRACWYLYKKSALYERLRFSFSKIESVQQPKSNGEDGNWV